ncbi:hypothetical protein DXG03_004258 [Asterophora parasitica]|uniref:Uncharacterized protein n=1 Tax=Asterophora parasitica TaxID=117018 RepID=A0A9P7G6V3_9AGAR|nr:hypothetical protein DXG03_004258 [Asterophora parasitica]
MAQITKNEPTRSALSSFLQSVSNHFKPHRAEALQRIRVNAFCILLLVVFSNLLPLPSLQRALGVVLTAKKPERWDVDWVWRWFCVAEVTFAGVFAFNVMEGVYAVKYPRSSQPTTPARPKTLFSPTPNNKRAFKVLSPNSSPQPQKSFSASLSQSASFSASPSKYASSPLSTPSRVVHYPSISTNTQASSTSTMAFHAHATPSPVVSAYRGKHANGVGRALDDSYLGRISLETEEKD